MKRSPVIFWSLALVGAIGLTACGGDDYGTRTTAAAVGSSSPTAGAPNNTAAAQSGPVQVKDTANLGKVLAASDGATLYTFKNDTDGKSNCSDACASTWPPLTVTAAPVKPDGVPGDFSLVNRNDGQKQLAFNGQPLYRYAADKAPADAKGEGVGGVWFAARATTAPGVATPLANPSDNGY